VVAACLIAKRAVNALILVHRRQLMDQWRERLAAFLALPIGHVLDNMGEEKRKENPGLIECCCNPKFAAQGQWKTSSRSTAT